jgi:hypothetical protein
MATAYKPTDEELLEQVKANHPSFQNYSKEIKELEDKIAELKIIK